MQEEIKIKDKLKHCKQLILTDRVSEAIEHLKELLSSPGGKIAETFYLLGNAYRKQGNWKEALDNYAEATALDADSPAVEAAKMIQDILNFYNKDMYNQ